MGCDAQGILEFRFGPNLGFKLEAGTKLNNKKKKNNNKKNKNNNKKNKKKNKNNNKKNINNNKKKTTTRTTRKTRTKKQGERMSAIHLCCCLNLCGPQLMEIKTMDRFVFYLDISFDIFFSLHQ